MTRRSESFYGQQVAALIFSIRVRVRNIVPVGEVAIDLDVRTADVDGINESACARLIGNSKRDEVLTFVCVNVNRIGLR